MIWGIYTIIGMIVATLQFRPLVKASRQAIEKYKEDESYYLLVLFISNVVVISLCLIIVLWPLLVLGIGTAIIIMKGKKNA